MNDEVLARVRELREAGWSPKQIARAVGLKPSQVAPLVRRIATDDAAAAPEPAVVGCWVSPGWNLGLTVDGHDDWPDVSAATGGRDGVASVIVARRQRSHRVTVCGYLVDVFCLGVKNALGPDAMAEGDLRGFVHEFFTPFHEIGRPVEAPLELVRHLVWGAVDYARGLGFEPAPDFEAAAGHLGTWEETSAITFGRGGMPLYVAGPYDKPEAVLRTLNRTVGRGNFHTFVPGAEGSAL